jgi:SAM-dependent methyltransferase
MMSLRRKTHNALRSFVQAYGTPTAKRRLWNAEFGRGRWRCLDATAGDRVYGYLERYSNQGHILDLGCGSGSTANELEFSAYASYVGVDIADVAIERARIRSEQNGRQAKNRFQQSDIESYVPAGIFDVILFRDSLYYLPRNSIVPTLDRYARYLSRTGVFIVRLADGREKYAPIVDAIERHFVVVERGRFVDPDALILVFRP